MNYAVNKRTKEHVKPDRNRYYPDYLWEHLDADADGWIEWRGGECPLPDGTRYKTKHKSGFVIEGNHPEALIEHWAGHLDPIVKYRPILDQPQAPEDCVTVRYDLDPANIEGAIREKLIEMGWTPPQDGLPEWDGEGLPPVGVECECFDAIQKEWVSAFIAAHHVNGEEAIWSNSRDGGELFYGTPHDFRPLRTDREKWIDQATDVALQPGNAAGNVYDALISGELPMPKTDNRH